MFKQTRCPEQFCWLQLIIQQMASTEVAIENGTGLRHPEFQRTILATEGKKTLSWDQVAYPSNTPENQFLI